MTTQNSNGFGTKIYRFQPYFHKDKADGHLRGQHISPDKLWFSTPKNLNDPMDIDHPIDDLLRQEGGDSPVLREMAKVMYDHEQPQFPHDFITEALLEKICQWARGGVDSWDMCDVFKERLLQLGVACFKSDWNNPPMWAHYASNWEGFVIEYCVRPVDMAISNGRNELWQFWMNYSSAIEPTSLSELLFSPYEAARRILSAKTLPWSYENEWRLVSLSGGDHSVLMPKDMRMTGVILGPKSPSGQEQLFSEKCKEWKLPLQRVNVGIDRKLRLTAVVIDPTDSGGCA